MNNDASDDGEVKLMNVADSCIVTVSCLVLFGMIFVTGKVFRIVKLGDKRLIFMLGFLDLTLLGKLDIGDFYSSDHIPFPKAYFKIKRITQC
jgi:hypothetical protein